MLLQPFSVSGRKTVEKLRTDHMGDAFGALACMDVLPKAEQVLKQFEGSTLSDELLKEWRRCVAEELLLRHACGQRVPSEWMAAFAGVSPFGNDVSLRESLKTPSACAIFPLAGCASTPEPGIGHVWVLQNFDQRDSCDGANIVSSNMGLCFVADCSHWGGRSWQLAGKMAEHAALKNPGAPIQRDLLDWVFTGAVDEQDHLVRVDGILCKSTFPLSAKRWLLPRENLVDPEFEGIRQRLRMVYTEASVPSATALVSGHGTRLHDLDDDRITCDEMHALVGGSPEPIIAAFLLSTAKQFTLWHTDASQTAAHTVREVLRGLFPESGLTPMLRSLPSNSVAGAEEALWEHIAKHPEKRIVINATGGNRLMFAAAQSMAKFFDNVRLIYRDLNADPHRFVELVYRQENPSEGTLNCIPPPKFANFNWSVLYADNRKKNLNSDGLLAALKASPFEQKDLEGKVLNPTHHPQY